MLSMHEAVYDLAQTVSTIVAALPFDGTGYRFRVRCGTCERVYVTRGYPGDVRRRRWCNECLPREPVPGGGMRTTVRK
jgi:hypothetical protein